MSAARSVFVVAGTIAVLGLAHGRPEAASPAASPTPAPSPAPVPTAACTTAAHRQFDFWIGEWDVYGQRGKAGVNRITRELRDCVLHERWEGARGLNGQSFNLYDAARDRWHQTWVDSQGSLLVLEGRFEGGRMVLQGERPGSAAGTTQLQRIAWTPISADSVRQLWETSSDGGRTWSVVFDGLYVRRGRSGE